MEIDMGRVFKIWAKNALSWAEKNEWTNYISMSNKICIEKVFMG